jgi:MFS family permease
MGLGVGFTAATSAGRTAAPMSGSPDGMRERQVAIITQPIDPLETVAPTVLEGERWRRWLGLFILLAGGMITTLVFTSVVPGLQKIAEHFKGGDSIFSAQLVVTMGPAGMAIAGPVAGWVIRRVGMRRTLFVGLALATVAGTCQLWVDSLPLLLASRFVLGASVISVDVALTTILGARYAGPGRARLVGFRGAIASVGTVTTMLFSGYLVQTYGWRAPAWMFALPLIFLILSLIAFDRPLEQADRKDEARALERFSVLDLWPIYLLSFIMSMAHTMPSFQLPFLLKENGITSAILVSRVPSLSAFVGIMTALCFGFIYSRIGRFTFVLASVCMGLGFIGVGFAPSYGAILACVVIEGIGAGMTQPYFASRVLDRVTAAQRGQAMGFMLSAVFIGHFMNPIIVKPIRDAVGIHMTFALVGAFLIAAAAVLGLRAVATRGQSTIV